MRNLVVQVLSGATTGNVTGSTIDTNQTVSASFQYATTDATATGTIQVQVSNDNPGPSGASGPSSAQFTPTNWSNLSSASITFTANQLNGVILVPVMSFRWTRIIYTRTAGAGTIAVNMNSLSV